MTKLLKTSRRKLSLLLGFLISLIPIATAVITLNYLGLSFDDEGASSTSSSLDKKDWQRKWLIFFAWFYIVSYILGLLFIRV